MTERRRLPTRLQPLATRKPLPDLDAALHEIAEAINEELARRGGADLDKLARLIGNKDD